MEATQRNLELLNDIIKNFQLMIDELYEDTTYWSKEDSRKEDEIHLAMDPIVTARNEMQTELLLKDDSNYYAYINSQID